MKYPYEIRDEYMSLVGNFGDRDHLMRAVHTLARTEGTANLRNFTVFYVGDDDSETYQFWCGDTRILDWYSKQERLGVALRLALGYDVVGLEEVVLSDGYLVEYEEGRNWDEPEDTFFGWQIQCRVKNVEKDSGMFGYGYTKPEALAVALERGSRVYGW